MKIKRILTNNAVVIEALKGREKIICGKGIGYKKRIGDEVDEEKVNQVFYLESNDLNLELQELLLDIPVEVVEISKEAIVMIKKLYNRKLSENIYISLLDHLHVAILRYEKGIFLKNEFLLYLKSFHEEEFLIAQKIIEMINEKLHINFDDNEAGFIALHIIECAIHETKENTTKIATIIEDIVNVVKDYYNRDFDESSVYYMKFITHLRFLVKRLIGDYEFNLEESIDTDGEMLPILSIKYHKASQCMEKVSKRLKEKYEYEINDEEKIYLIIHIERLVVKLK